MSINRIFVLLALLFANSCGVVSQKKRDHIFVPPDMAPVSYRGRWDLSQPARPSASWPGFSISFGASGGPMKVVMKDFGNCYNLTIDGNVASVTQGKYFGRSVWDIPLSHDGKVHIVELQRRNCSKGLTSTLHGFLLSKETKLHVLPEPQKPTIEWIGDSFTVGENNLASGHSLFRFSHKSTTDFAQSFASLVSKKLGAEALPVCRSGTGLVCDYRGRRHPVFHELYGRSLMEDPSSIWPGNRKSSELVIISLGLNDYSGLKRADGSVKEEDSLTFREAYHQCIKIVRQQNPTARIVILAPHIPWIRENAQRVVATEKSQGFKHVYYAQYDWYPDGYAADGHPTAATHQKIAKELLQQLRQLGLP